MEHVKQENNISEENRNAVSSDPKLEIDIQAVDLTKTEDNNKHVQNRMVASADKLELPKELKESKIKIYRCSTCSFQTRYKASISQHENIHLPPEDRPTARCSHCGNIYLSKKGLSRHLRRKHGYSRRGQPLNVINYGCVKCNYTTDSKDSFSEHCLSHVLLNSKVAYKKRHECPTCCAKFVVQSSLDVHRIAVHKGGNEKKTEEDNEIILVQKKLQQYMDKYNENVDSISLANEDKDSVTIQMNFDAPFLDQAMPLDPRISAILTRKAMHDHMHDDSSKYVYTMELDGDFE